MSAERPSSTSRPPHPATLPRGVAQPKTAAGDAAGLHPATLPRSAAQPKRAAEAPGPHPATLPRGTAAQPKAATGGRAPHPATLPRGSAAQPKTSASVGREPHPATLSRGGAVQRQAAGVLAPHPAMLPRGRVGGTAGGGAVQRMESKYELVLSKGGECLGVRVNGEEKAWMLATSKQKKDPPYYLVSGPKPKWKLRYFDGTSLDEVGFFSIVEGTVEETITEAIEEKKLPSIVVKLPGKSSIHPTKAFKQFESGQLAIHYKKHVEEQGEFGEIEQKTYLLKALTFGNDDDVKYIEAKIGKTFIRCSPPIDDPRFVFIGYDTMVRTFYVWNPKFSKDPFAFAIAFTIERLAHGGDSGVRDELHQELEKYDIDYKGACKEVDNH